MKSLACFGKKLQNLCSCSCMKLACYRKSFGSLIVWCYRFIIFRVNQFWIQLFYFSSLSFMGFWVLKALKPRVESYRPRDLDMFFMSVSAVTVSSMSTIEMEFFSNTQLIILTTLMFIGGEVFTSMLGLQFAKSKFKKLKKTESNRIRSVTSSPCSVPPNDVNQIELGLATVPSLENQKPDAHQIHDQVESIDNESLKYNSIRFLGYVVLGYLVVVHLVGTTLVSLYLSSVDSARDVLRNKDLKLMTFSVFTTVSTFASCGFVPTNENMVVFKKNPGLLLILVPQVLLGNTLFPTCLRFIIWAWGKCIRKRDFEFLLKNTKQIGFLHLLPSLHSSLLVVTVFGFIVVQLILFCSMEWNSEALDGLSSYQKTVGGFFQSVNSRHTGETIVDISIISPAILVLFIIMMYLPPYTSFLPIKAEEQSSSSCRKRKGKSGRILDNLIFSQLSYLVVFIILICVTERKKMKEDPLNFNVLNIVTEVISAYGNVGFTTGYSCKRQLHPDANCKDTWFGFSGRWSSEGKIILILVMFFGRLKKFNMDGGKAWKLL